MKNKEDIQTIIAKQFQEFHYLLESKPRTRNKSDTICPTIDKTTRNISSSSLVRRNFNLKPASRTIDRSLGNIESKFVVLSKNRLSSCKEIEKTQLSLNETSLKSNQVAWDQDKNKEIVKFIRGLHIFGRFKLEILDLFELARNNDTKNELEGLSLLFSLESVLNKPELEVKSNSLEGDIEKLISMYLNFSKELINMIKSNGDKDSAVIVELLTRLHIKTLDSALAELSKTIQNIEKSHEHSISALRSIKKEDLQIVKDFHKVKASETDKALECLTAQNEEMRKNIVKLRSDLDQKNKDLARLTELDHGFSAMQSMDALLRNLESVIIDAKDSKKQKSKMIQNFQSLFESVEEISKPVQSKTIETMTDWSISSLFLPIPLLSYPKLSNNPLLNLRPGQITISPSSIKDRVIELVQSFDGDKGFLFHLAENIFSSYSEKEEKTAALYELASQTAKGESNWQILSKKLLGFEDKPLKIIEKSLHSFIKVFESSANIETTETFIEAPHCIGIIEKDFKPFPRFQSWILSNMKFYNDKAVAGLIDNRFSSFCLRFSLAYEKQKIGLKQNLEKIDRRGMSNY